MRRLSACLFEVPQVNIFLLLCLKLVETNNCRCRRAHTPRPLSLNNGAKRTPKVSLLHLNLACPSEIEKHWKRRVLPNQNDFSSCVPSCWVTPSSSQPGTRVSALWAPLVHQGALLFYFLALCLVIFLPLLTPASYSCCLGLTLARFQSVSTPQPE